MPMPSWLSGTSLPRPLGWVTAAYSAAIIVRPKVLAAPCGFVDSRGEVQREGATVIAAVGARDVASGLAMALVPAGKPKPPRPPSSPNVPPRSVGSRWCSST